MNSLLHKSSRLLGVILARGGSIGVPKKNITGLAGKPLLAWTVLAAQESKVLDRLVLSTDDSEIARVGQQYGAEVPFVRPAVLSRSDTSSMDALLHCVDWLEMHEGYMPDYVLLLQPTSPLRMGLDIVGAWELMSRVGEASVIGICEARQHPFWAKKLAPDGRLLALLRNAVVPSIRQELPKAYIVNGAIYLAPVNRLRATKSFYSDPAYGYLMPAERSVDVDTHLDLKLAELLLTEKEYA